MTQNYDKPMAESSHLILSKPQHIFLNVLDTKFKAYVSGYGGGKTFIGCIMLLCFIGRHPKAVVGYFGATYPSIRDIFFPTFRQAAEMLGFTINVNEKNKEVHVYRNGLYYGVVICRSMERPESIVGFKIAMALVDELDVLSVNKAKTAWKNIIARLRLKIEGVVNSVGVTTTPEGFKFVYQMFDNNPTESYSMVQASTYENEKYLPDDYIDSLYETYDSQLVKAYIYGKFVNLVSGSVYRKYDRLKHRSHEFIQDREHLHIGMDFNVGKMAAVVYVHRKNQEHIVKEHMKILDTPQMIEVLKSNYKDRGHEVFVYPDATGKNRETVGASQSDISLLKAAGFIVRAKESNPFIKDRVLSVNKGFEDNKLFINDALAPITADCVEQQAYDKNGLPDKSANSAFDHACDAMGYEYYFNNPIRKPLTHVNIRGHIAR